MMSFRKVNIDKGDEVLLRSLYETDSYGDVIDIWNKYATLAVFHTPENISDEIVEIVAHSYFQTGDFKMADKYGRIQFNKFLQLFFKNKQNVYKSRYGSIDLITYILFNSNSRSACFGLKLLNYYEMFGGSNSELIGELRSIETCICTKFNKNILRFLIALIVMMVAGCILIYYDGVNGQMITVLKVISYISLVLGVMSQINRGKRDRFVIKLLRKICLIRRSI